jgi:hypothetical protein
VGCRKERELGVKLRWISSYIACFSWLFSQGSTVRRFLNCWCRARPRVRRQTGVVTTGFGSRIRYCTNRDLWRVRVCVGRCRSLNGDRRCCRVFRGRLSYDAFDVVLVEDVDVEVDWQHDVDVPEVRYCRFFLSDSE